MKPKLKLITLGGIPFEFKINNIKKWKSNLFEIQSEIDEYALQSDSDLDDWQYSDDNITQQLPKSFEGDILFVMTSVPLQSNYFSRRLSNNRVCITFSEMSNFLKGENIPIENMIFRLLYSYTFAYLSHENNLPTNIDFKTFTHDETKGCLFDMNGIKKDIIYSTHKPIICPSCIEKLKSHKVSQTSIHLSQKEIKKIKKKLYYRILDFVKKHPITAFLFSALLAIILGVIGSLIATYIWEALKK